MSAWISINCAKQCLLQVCLAFESVDVGQHMLTWATKFCLFPDDEVYIVHCLSKVRSSLQCIAAFSAPMRLSKLRARQACTLACPVLNETSNHACYLR